MYFQAYERVQPDREGMKSKSGKVLRDTLTPQRETEVHEGSGLSVTQPKFTSRVHRPLPQVTGMQRQEWKRGRCNRAGPESGL